MNATPLILLSEQQENNHPNRKQRGAYIVNSGDDVVNQGRQEVEATGMENC